MSGCPYAVPIYHRRRSPVPTAILRRLTTLVFRETEVLKSRETLYEARDQSELTRSDVVLLGGLHAALGISRIGTIEEPSVLKV
jgi:hypothetical protein